MDKYTIIKRSFTFYLVAVNYSLKSGAFKHHQMLDFNSGDALPGLYCNHLQFLLVVGGILSSVLSSAIEMHARSDSGQVIDLDIA